MTTFDRLASRPAVPVPPHREGGTGTTGDGNHGNHGGNRAGTTGNHAGTTPPREPRGNHAGTTSPAKLTPGEKAAIGRQFNRAITKVTRPALTLVRPVSTPDPAIVEGPARRSGT